MILWPGEFSAKTNLFVFDLPIGSHDDAKPWAKKVAVVLGSGPYHIGSSVEFDWSSVMAARALEKSKTFGGE